jgi:hypothetical protein
MSTDATHSAAKDVVAQSRLYRAQWAVLVLTLGGAGLLGVLGMPSAMTGYVFLGAMTAYRLRCPRCGKLTMFSYGTASIRRACPHCEWPKPES